MPDPNIEYTARSGSSHQREDRGDGAVRRMQHSHVPVLNRITIFSSHRGGDFNLFAPLHSNIG